MASGKPGAVQDIFPQRPYRASINTFYQLIQASSKISYLAVIKSRKYFIDNT